MSFHVFNNQLSNRATNVPDAQSVRSLAIESGSIPRRTKVIYFSIVTLNWGFKRVLLWYTSLQSM